MRNPRRTDETTLSFIEISVRRATMRRAFGRAAILLCVLWGIVATSMGLPVEQPTRFTLSTGDANAKNVEAQAAYSFELGRVSETFANPFYYKDKSAKVGQIPILSMAFEYVYEKVTSQRVAAIFQVLGITLRYRYWFNSKTTSG